MGTLIAAILRITLKSNEHLWEQTLVNRRTVKLLAILTLLIWVGIVILGLKPPLAFEKESSKHRPPPR